MAARAKRKKDDKKQPIIVRKRVRPSKSHVSAWKLAYADFVTALLAFFLLMWLLTLTSARQRAGIANVFEHPSAIEAPGGASTSMIQLGGTRDMVSGPRPEARTGGSGRSSKHELTEAEKRLDRRRLQTLEQQIKNTVDRSQALKPFKDQLLISITPRGLHIQIIDKKNRPMFDLGSATLKPYAKAILKHIGAFLNEVPNKIAITGETDAHKFVNRRMSNWSLSTQRANAARRALIAGGMQPGKVERVVGLGDTVLFDKANPFAAVNRRISIIVLSKRAEKAMARGDRYQ